MNLQYVKFINIFYDNALKFWYSQRLAYFTNHLCTLIKVCDSLPSQGIQYRRWRLQHRVSTIATEDTIPKMAFTVQNINYRYRRDDSEDGVYSTEYRLLLQKRRYRRWRLQYRVSTIATEETIPKMTFRVQNINYRYRRDDTEDDV